MGKKRILIIGEGFPGLGGSRIFKFNGFLPQLGYEPIVLTNKVKIKGGGNAEELRSESKVYKTVCLNKSPFRVFSKFFNSWSTTVYFEKLFFVPDLYATWVPSAVLRGLDVIKREKIDVVITSSPPESVHITGLFLKKLTGTKWIADFQDLWTTKKIVNKPPTFLHDLVIKELEKIIYENCDHLIANTYGNKVIYKDYFKIPEEKITVITNGYDAAEILNTAAPIKQLGEFCIGYMGFFDKPGFPWKEFLLAMKKLIDCENHGEIKLNLCGHLSNQAKQFIEEQGLKKFVKYHGMVKQVKALEEMKRNDVLLLLMYENDYSKAIVPHKLYYYLGMSKPVLAVAEEYGEVADIIRRTKTGRIVSIKKENGIYNMLMDYYKDWKSHGLIEYTPNIEEIRRYEYSNLTKKLYEVINNIS